ncbi:uncharacterized protein LOC126234997 [Schistocerca nitens]|uniref:uncharacterized protein LOC126234997 n=1 Tax=Schistocerca nitens TaxID=7011 RepID=UPI0021173CEE|nr:uncharacterized protein LOC126234997 [Schistocerca nitens]
MSAPAGGGRGGGAGGGEPAARGGLQLARSVTRYASCTVDPRPARAVHCPDLNACLLGDAGAAASPVDCRAVHFGYAVPVNVVPVEAGCAELVLDAGTDLSPAAVSYLLERHPQLREEAARARHAGAAPADRARSFRPVSSSSASSTSSAASGSSEPEEDIAAIAKQISDHAEAIYQTWKSRGLKPTEILSCHAADKFVPTLTPPPPQQQQQPRPAPAEAGQRRASPAKTSPVHSPSQTPMVDLLASEASLEQFVNNFVSEDKARLAAARQRSAAPSSPSSKALPSSIQYALQKFERPAQQPQRQQPAKTPSPVTSPYLEHASPVSEPAKSRQADPPRTSPYTHIRTSSIPSTTPTKTTVPFQKLILGDTIETIFPPDLPKQQQQQPQPSPASQQSDKSAGGADSSGLTTWPLKNKVVGGSVVPEKTAAKTGAGADRGKSKFATLPSEAARNNNHKNTAQYLDEVAREEERLINALKTGIIIAEEPSPAAPASAKKASLLSKKNSANSAPVVATAAEPKAGKPAVRAAAAATGAPAARPRPEPVPHPELTSQQRQHIRQSASNPVRPFLTRGSVAERVLIFEKCPSEALLRGRPTPASWQQRAAAAQAHARDKENIRPTSLPPNTTLQRHVKANRNVHIPRFYFPKGKPSSEQNLDAVVQKISAAFQQFPGQQVSQENFTVITKACDCPLYWKVPLFIAAGGEKLGHVEANSFIDFWKQLSSSCHDQASRFMYILTKGQMRPLVADDFVPLVQDVVDTHPGLTFLKEATEFHSRYVHTVITRIFYCVNRSWSGKITLPELRRSDLLRIIQLLEEEEDINQVTAYFSYEHFYVIYCKFWELDRDHDLYIDRQDLARHSEHALSSRMIDRIFSGAVTRGPRHEDKMSYTDFVWFLLSEEDKTHPTAIEYWFRCMDLDGDGFLSMYELEYFYEEQLQRMEALGMETLPFEDCLCQMLDMIHPAIPGKISLADLKRCKMTPIFFDTFFNLEKYLDHEQRDPFASQRDHDTDGHELSDWDRYAAEEYELLVAEEGGNEQQEDLKFEDDAEEDALSPNLDNIMMNMCGENKPLSTNGEHPNPILKVTDFDLEDGDDSADYAADSDCSI